MTSSRIYDMGFFFQSLMFEDKVLNVDSLNGTHVARKAIVNCKFF